VNEYHYGAKGRFLGQKPAHEFIPFIGKVISKISINKDGNQIDIEFKDGTAIGFKSDEPDCCASHYIVTDDKLEDYVNAKLHDVIKKPASREESEHGDVLETIFFEIVTSKGSIICRSHNSHNGYYGGVGVNLVILRSIQSAGKFRQ
jgi:hypothetical protein